MHQLAWLGIVGGVAAYAIKKSGLLALAGRVRGGASPAAADSWLCFLAHFRLSIAVLLASLAAGWLVRAQLVMWLVEPLLQAWGAAALGVARAQLLHFSSAAEAERVLLLGVLSVIWVPVVPFVASDAWRLMLPLMDARAARFRVAFAVVAGLVALGVVLVVRQYLGPSAFGFAQLDRPEL